MSLPVTIAKGIGVTSLFLVRNAPSILTAGGVCAMLGATVTAVKQSLRYHEEVSEPAITDLALAEVEGDEKKRTPPSGASSSTPLAGTPRRSSSRRRASP